MNRNTVVDTIISYAKPKSVYILYNTSYSKILGIYLDLDEVVISYIEETTGDRYVENRWLCKGIYAPFSHDRVILETQLGLLKDVKALYCLCKGKLQRYYPSNSRDNIELRKSIVFMERRIGLDIDDNFSWSSNKAFLENGNVKNITSTFALPKCNMQYNNWLFVDETQNYSCNTRLE
jgi:hypothetical protein